MYKCIITILLSGILLFVGCQDYASPDKIYVPDEPAIESPEITAIVPADSAVPGTYEIRIVGENFTDVRDSIEVYFDGVPAQLKSISKTELVIYHPGVVSDSTNVSIVVPGALTVAQYKPYKFCKVRYNVSNFQENSKGRLGPMAVDAEGNLYIANTSDVIFQVTPSGEKLIHDVDVNDFSKVSDMKIGPAGLYIAVDGKEIYTVDINSWESAELVSLPEKVAELDFDANGILYAGRRDGIFAIKPDQTYKLVGYNDDYRIATIRVFNGNIYVLARYKGDDQSLPEFGLFKSQILDADGTLGPVQLEVNLSEQGEFSAVNLKFTHESFAIDENGTFYFNNAMNPDYAILVLRDGQLEPLYHNTLTVPDSINNVVWGNGTHLYLSRSLDIVATVDVDKRPRRVFSLDLGTIKGAPYYGRNN